MSTPVPDDLSLTHMSVIHLSETLSSDVGQAILSLNLVSDPYSPRLSDDPYTRRLEIAALCRAVGRLLGVPVR